jgi:hypothetical protein
LIAAGTFNSVMTIANFKHNLSNMTPNDSVSTDVNTYDPENQIPFISLHPLSSQISEVKSHFTGTGLSNPKQYDNFWL